MSTRDPCAGYFPDVYLKYCPCLKKLPIYCCTPEDKEEKELLSTGAGLSQSQEIHQTPVHHHQWQHRRPEVTQARSRCHCGLVSSRPDLKSLKIKQRQKWMGEEEEKRQENNNSILHTQR